MTVDYSTLAAGQEVSNRLIRVDGGTVSKYVGAVADSTALPGGPGEAKAPPMAVAALGLRGVLEDLGIPSGALHAGQELSFSGPVDVEASLRCRATVARNSVRRGSRFVDIALSVLDDEEMEVMSGTTTLIMQDQAG